MDGINIIIPAIISDLPKIIGNIEYIYKYLDISKIVIVGNDEAGMYLSTTKNIEFINENELVPYNHIKSLIKKRADNSDSLRRTGWYLQQFLKMAYARVCQEDFYLLWDCDTIPIRDIDLFDKYGRAYLDYKTEYHKPYFDTMSRVLPELKKSFSGSFISEHMLINTKHMCELLDKIEANESLPGTMFYEKIINAISIKDLHVCGFSEFETFGSYLLYYHRDEIALRRWYSLRYGGYFFDNSFCSNGKLKNWLSRNYHAVSLEKSHKKSFLRFIAISRFGYLFPSNILEFYSFVIRIVNRILKIMSHS